MPSRTTHYALDIGTDALKLVRFIPAHRPHILGVSRYPISSGSLSHAGEGHRSMSSSLNEFLKAEDPSRRKPVYVAMPAAETFVRYFSLPAIPDHKIKKIIVFEAEQQIPMPINEVVWDYVLFDGADKRKRNAMLCAVRQDAVSGVRNALRAMRFSVERISAGHVALYHWLRALGYGGKNIMLIDIGFQTTHVLITSHASPFWSRGLSQGGEKLVRLIQQRNGVSFEEAHHLVRSVRVNGMDSTGTSSFFLEMINEVSRTVSFYQAQGSVVPPERVLLTGGLSAVNGLAAFFEKQLGLKTERANVSSGFDLDREASAALEKDHGTFSVALGLAAEACQKRIAPISLISNEERRAWGTREGRKRFYMASALTVLCLCLSVVNVYSERSMKKNVLDHQRLKLAMHQKAREKEIGIENAVEKLDRKLASIRSRVQRKSLPTEIFSELRVRTPEDIWYRSLAYESADASVRLECVSYGSLSDINQLAAHLEESPLFTSVELLSAGIETGRKSKEEVVKDATEPMDNTGLVPIRILEESQTPARIFSLRMNVETADDI